MTVQTSDPREALLIASGMSKLPCSAFFLKAWGGGEDALPEGEEFRLDLRAGLTQPWLSDYTRNKEDPFLLDARYVRVFDHWVSSNVSEKQAVRQERRMVEHLYDETSTRWSKAVFVATLLCEREAVQRVRLRVFRRDGAQDDGLLRGSRLPAAQLGEDARPLGLSHRRHQGDDRPAA